MGDLQGARQDLERFKTAVSKSDTGTAQRLLSQLKVKLIELQALGPQLDSSAPVQDARLLAREVLEQAVFLSIKLKDEAAFERNFFQLQAYYTDTRLGPPSPLQDLIVGLNLLRLLVQNNIAEFHTELELLSAQVRHSTHVAQATQLEQWLMEGAYTKVLGARQSAPDPAYAYFLDKLQSTVRDEIAGCSEQAYLDLPIKEAARLMMFKSEDELTEYAAQRGWQVQDGQVLFQSNEEEGVEDVPAVDLIKHALTYARELERIV